jgi:subtilase-type serine protease
MRFGSLVPLALFLSIGSASASDLNFRVAAAFQSPEYFGNDGLAAIGASAAYGAGFTGAGTTIAIIDDGFDIAHPDLAPQILEQIDTGGAGGNVPVAFHGTHVAGIAAAARNGSTMHGVAFDAGLALYTNGNVFPSNIFPAAAFRAASMLRPAAISNSYGFDLDVNFALDNRAGFFGAFPELTPFIDAVRNAQRHSVVLFAVSNKESFADIDVSAGLPLLVPELAGAWLAVVNMNGDGELISAPCGSGAQFCLAGPGADILSTVPGGGYAPETGTSMATPHVAGVVAIARQMFPSATPAELASMVLQTAIDVGEPGIDYEFGWGFANLANIVASIDPRTGDIFPAAAWSRFETLRQFGQTMRQRLSITPVTANGRIQPLGYGPVSVPAAFKKKPAIPRNVWISAIGGRSNLDAGAVASAYRSEMAGLAAGIDAELDAGLRLGVAAGYSNSSLRAGPTGNTGTADGVHAGLYGSLPIGLWRLEGSFQAAHYNQHLTRRSVSGASGTSVTPVGVSNPKTLAGEAELRAGRMVETSAGPVMPFVHVSARSQRTRAFRESGAGIFSLSLPSSTLSQVEAGPGLKAGTTLDISADFDLTASVDASYSYVMGDRNLNAQPALLGRAIAAAAALPGKHALNIGGEASLRDREGALTATVFYRGRFQRNTEGHTGGFMFRMAF